MIDSTNIKIHDKKKSDTKIYVESFLKIGVTFECSFEFDANKNITNSNYRQFTEFQLQKVK